MGASGGRTQRLNAGRNGAAQRKPNAAPGRVYVSRSAAAAATAAATATAAAATAAATATTAAEPDAPGQPGVEAPMRGAGNAAPPGLAPRLPAARGGLTSTPGQPGAAPQNRVRRLRDLARAGRLAEIAAAARGPERAELTGAAFDVAWPIVFSRLTSRFEHARGHRACASGVGRLADECLDRFHEDVEAVVEDLLTHARKPVLHLEAWIAGRLTAATVDHHRRLRGQRGALQRPRLPMWVADGLAHDQWLMTLATEILVWVGVSSTAGTEVWPLESWSQQRGVLTGDWAAGDPAVIAREVELVLTVMRRRPQWYESYVERPLGAKHAPVASAAVGDATGEVAVPLVLTDPAERTDAELRRLAGEAVRAIDARVAHGEPAESAAVEVIRTVFGGSLPGALERAPHAVADPVGGLTGALANAATLDRITRTVSAILAEERGGA